MKKKLIEMPENLLKEVDQLAKDQSRSGVKQIVHYVEQGVKRDKKKK